MDIKHGGARLGLDAVYTHEEELVDGLVATDGIQYSAIATFGTTAVDIFSKFIDPGVPALALKKLQVGLTQMFTGLNGSFVASLAGYYWTITPEYAKTTGSGAPYKTKGAAINITGTYTKAVGTLATSEDTFYGNVPVGSVPFAPFTITLTARGIQAVVCQGKVKNASFVRMVGEVIPGT